MIIKIKKMLALGILVCIIQGHAQGMVMPDQFSDLTRARAEVGMLNQHEDLIKKAESLLSEGKNEDSLRILDTASRIEEQSILGGVEENSTALMKAASKGFIAGVEALLKHPNINAGITDGRGRTALNIANVFDY